jgi:hypothetical protein
LNEAELRAIEDEVDAQAKALPRMDIVRGSLAHSTLSGVQAPMKTLPAFLTSLTTDSGFSTCRIRCSGA